MGQKPFIEANADGMNALARSLGALVFATVRRLSASEKEAFAQDLEVMAQAMSMDGDTTSQMLLADLRDAATRAAATC